MNLTEAMALEARALVNPEEFGEPVLLDGLPLTGVVTRPRVDMLHGMDLDIPRLTRTLSVATVDLPEGFEPSGTLDYQGEVWSVSLASTSGGITRFELTKAL